MLWCVRRSWRVPAGERPVREGCSEPPGSECCAGVGDGDCEAYTAIRWGVGLSLERDNVAEAEAVISVEGNMCGTVMRGAAAAPASKATSRPERNAPEPERSHVRPQAVSRLVRIGKARSRSEEFSTQSALFAAGSALPAGAAPGLWSRTRHRVDRLPWCRRWWASEQKARLSGRGGNVRRLGFVLGLVRSCWR